MSEIPELALESGPARVHPSNELFLPIHGFVHFTREELDIVNHPALQRLGEIYQLGQTHLVFRGATHKRLEHVLGCVHVAQMMIDAVEHNHKVALLPKPHKARSTHERPLSRAVTPAEEAFIRLAALLHDVGHLPAGHTLEDELKLLAKHDSVERLELVFDRKDWLGEEEPDEPTLRQLVDKYYAQFCPNKGVSASDVVFAIVAKNPRKSVETKADFRVKVCRDIVGNTICADLLDYLHRDWFHIGKPQHFDTRLFQYMEIRENAQNEDEFVISMGQSHRVKSDAITAIVNLLQARYSLAETVLFHRAKCSAAAMLERAIQELRLGEKGKKDEWDTKLEKHLLDYSDAGAVKTLLRKSQGHQAATTPLKALLRRSLYKPIFALSQKEASNDYDRLHDMFSTPDDKEGEKDQSGAQERARLTRLNAVRQFEKDFGFPEGTIVMYFPSKTMNAKIPEVKIHADGAIQTFQKWNGPDNFLDSGHVAALNSRFRKLWRVLVCLHSKYYDKLQPEMLDYLETCVKELIFDISGSHLKKDELAHKLALQGTVVPGSPFFSKTILPLRKAAQVIQDGSTYPWGAPSLASFFRAKE